VKKMIALWMVLGLCTVYAQDTKKAEPPKTPPKAEEAKPAEPKTLKADADFVQQYQEVMALQSSIAQLERESGIPRLRELSNAKIAKLRQWMIEKKVDGWQYDEKTQTFTEKPAPAKK
jgi:hypothetical protein